MNKIKMAKNRLPKTEDKKLCLMSKENIEKVIHYHQSFPQYCPTPLVKLGHLSEYLGIDSIYVKDESYRFGLNSFKVLGGSFAIGSYIAERLGKVVEEVSFPFLTSKETQKQLGSVTFITATDGNHGRGVAWAAKELKQQCIVRMPKGSTQVRKEHIAALGAEVTIEDKNYDDCVRLASSQADEVPNGILVQDTAWEGYEKIPAQIMQGYGTLAVEAEQQMQEEGCQRPTHIFVQAGVGSLAASVVGYFVNRYPDNPPIMVVVEADAADCLYQSALAATGDLKGVEGDLRTIMAGLACGEGNVIAWDILKNHVDAFISAPDWASEKGSRIYGNPLTGDAKVVSGESGSVTMGVLASILSMKQYEGIKKELKLDKNSKILLISTEGDTDPERYRKIVWDGLSGR